MRMIAVDLWAPQPGYRGYGTENYDGGWNHEARYRNFTRHVAANFPGRVAVVRKHTAEAALAVADKSLDFVFIDADHTEHACYNDIYNWRPKIRDGGMISGHDIHWPSVRRAIERAAIHRVIPDTVEVGFDNTWWTFL